MIVTQELMLPHMCRSKGELTSEEIQDAEVHTIKSTRQKTFKREYPPLAPHFGSVCYTMIKVAKQAINAVLGNAYVIYVLFLN